MLEATFIQTDFFLLAGCLLVAFFYTSAGFGGGSGYLALFSLWGMSYLQAPALALAFNIIATAIACTIAWRAGHLQLRPYLWLFLGSMPAILIGSTLPINSTIFTILLCISLAFASLRFFFWPALDQSTTQPVLASAPSSAPALDLMMGAGLGLLAGMTGIGGGIFLAPLLLWMKRGTAHEQQAATASFILINSSLGLGVRYVDALLQGTVSQHFAYITNFMMGMEIFWLMLVVIIGALAGATFAHRSKYVRQLRYSTGLVVLIATISLAASTLPMQWQPPLDDWYHSLGQYLQI